MATRTLTDTATISWDEATANQVKGNVPDDAITNAKLADMAEATIKGRAAGAGSGNPTDLTDAQVATILGLSAPGSGITDFPEIAEPESPAANVARQYAKDIGGVTTLFAKDSGGRERVLQGVAFDVREYGAVGDGNLSGVGTNDRAAIQDAINAADTSGGGIVQFDGKIYVIGSPLDLKNNVELRGVQGVTVIIMASGTDFQLLRNADQQVGNTPVDNVSLYGIIFDGNKTNAAAVLARSAVGPDPCRKFRAIRCIFRNALGYGLAFQSREGHAADGPVEDIYLEDCHFHDNGDGVDAGVTVFDGLDVKDVDRLTAIGCTAYNNTLDGLDVRGREITFINCSGFDNGGSGLEANANVDGVTSNSTMTVIGGQFSGNLNGIRLANGGTGTGVSRYALFGPHCTSNDTFGIAVLDSGTRGEISIHAPNCSFNGSHGISVEGTHRGVDVIGGFSRSNTGSGVYLNSDSVTRIVGIHSVSNTRYGVEEGANGVRNIIGDGCQLTANTIGAFLPSANKYTRISSLINDFTVGSGDIIASAGTITLPHGGHAFFVSGTTTITSVTASWRGRTVSLQLAGNITVTSGSNLSLRGNFVGSSGATLTLMSDGTDWFEVGRKYVSLALQLGDEYSSPTLGVGYRTGAGGAVTQITSRSTGVTLNTICGAITTNNASLTAEASASFVVTNSTVDATDTVVVSIRSGSNGGNTAVTTAAVSAGSFAIRVSNNNAAAGTAETGAIVINFAVIKAVAA